MDHSTAVRIARGGEGAIVSELLRLDMDLHCALERLAYRQKLTDQCVAMDECIELDKLRNDYANYRKAVQETTSGEMFSLRQENSALNQTVSDLTRQLAEQKLAYKVLCEANHVDETSYHNLQDQLAEAKKYHDAFVEASKEYYAECQNKIDAANLVIAERDATIEKLRDGLKWQTGIIPQTGWYWIWDRTNEGSFPYVTRKIVGELVSTAQTNKIAQWWAGPILPPKEDV